MEVAVAIGIGAEGDPADRLNPGHILDRLVKEPADQEAPLGVQGGLLAVEVEIALPARGQGHLPFFVGKFDDDLLELFTIRHYICSFSNRSICGSLPGDGGESDGIAAGETGRAVAGVLSRRPTVSSPSSER